MNEPEPEQDGSQRRALAGLAIAVVLLVVGLWLAHELTAASKMQDFLEKSYMSLSDKLDYIMAIRYNRYLYRAGYLFLKPHYDLKLIGLLLY